MNRIVWLLPSLLVACGPAAPFTSKLLKAYPSDRAQHVEAAGLAFQDKMWLVTGTEGSPSNGCECEGSPTRDVDIWDPATDSWSSGPKVNVPRAKYPNVYQVGDSLYLVGGIAVSADGGSDYRPPVEKLAPPYSQWEVIANSTSTYSTFDTRAGGVDGTKILMADESFSGDNAVNIYDTATNTWSSRPAAGVPMGSFATGNVIGGKLYAIGGLTGDLGNVHENESIQAYDIASDTWSEVAKLPMHPKGDAMHETMTVIHDGKLVTLGGDDDGTGMHVFDPAANKVQRYQDVLAEERADHVTGVINGVIYLVGGIRPHSTDDYVPTIEVKKAP